MDAKLVVVGGEAKSGEVKIKKLPSVVGRSDDADIRLRHPLVSRKHCEIYEQNGFLKVRDLGSMNGTFIANNKIKDATLKPDELVTIGPVVFRAVYEAPAGAEVEDDAEFDLDFGDEFEVDETQPVDIKRTTAVKETVMFDDLDSLDEKPSKATKKLAPAAAADDDLSDLDDLSFDIEMDDAADEPVKPATPEKAAAADVAMDDDEFADLIEVDVEQPPAPKAGEKTIKDIKDADDDFADLDFDLDDITNDEEEPAPAKQPAGKKEPAMQDAKAAPAAKADDFDIDLGDVGEDEELDDFLKDLGLEKKK